MFLQFNIFPVDAPLTNRPESVLPPFFLRSCIQKFFRLPLCRNSRTPPGLQPRGSWEDLQHHYFLHSKFFLYVKR